MKISSFLNWGHITQRITNFFESNITTQIKQIKREFFHGRINQSFMDIKDALNEYSSSERNRYKLLILQTEFYLVLRDYDKVKLNMQYVEQYMEKHLEESFFIMKAILLSLDKNQDEFNCIVTKLIMEFSHLENPKEYFDLIYFLNSFHLEEAETLYEHYQNTHQVLSNQFKYIGGMIYANLYIKKNENIYFEKAQKSYNDYLANANPNFFEKLEIYNFLSSDKINKLLQGNIESNNLEILKLTKNHLEILDEKDILFFATDYCSGLKNHYLHCMFFLNKEEYIKTYQLYSLKVVDLINFIFYYIKLAHENLSFLIIEERILERNESQLLIEYLNELIYRNPAQVVKFLSEHKQYLEDDIVFNCYLDSTIKTTKNIDDNILLSLEVRKNRSLSAFISYLEAQQYLNHKLKNDDLISLFNLIKISSPQEILIIKGMKLLSSNNYQKEYLELGMKYKDLYRNITLETLKICNNDKDLLLEDFEKFISSIEVKPHAIIIANTYLAYRKLNQAYEFYKMAWNYIELKQQDKIKFACSVLQNCTLQNYMINHGKVLNTDQDQIYKCYLESQIDQLSIEECCVLSYYLIVVEKNFETGFRYINTQLLNHNIHNLTIREQEILSTLYFVTIIDNHSLNNINTNILLEQDDQYYISKNQYSYISEHYNFQLLEQRSFELLSRQINIKKLSIYHKICHEFIVKMKSKYFTTFISSTDNPLGDIKEIINEYTKKDRNDLVSYSDGENISLFHLANHQYEKYFDLIPTLLESPNIIFDTASCNVLPFEIKKILTLSSIILLNHINMLTQVLSREDIYIQQTTIDWLLNYIRSLDKKDEILTVYSDENGELYKNIIDKDEILSTQEYLINLATKLADYKNIINDEEEIIGIKESYDMLAPIIGHQEYKAMAFSKNYNYQIITEDRIIKIMFQSLKWNEIMTSNSISLLGNILTPDSFFEVLNSLHEKKYRYIFNELTIKNILKKIVFEEFLFMLENNSSKFLTLTVRAAYEYGWLKDIYSYYEDHYIFKTPMLEKPRKDFICRNIEFLKKIIDE